jgi:hypothetical protein
MNFFGREIEGHPKALVILVTILLVSGGLCGIQLAIANGGSPGSYGGNAAGILLPLGLIELAAMILSTIGIVIVLILWAISSARRQR